MKGPSIVPQSVFKQKARQLKRDKSLKQHQANNEAAKFFGYSNYKHYLNVLEESQLMAEASQRVGQQMMASHKRGEIFKKMESLTPLLQSLKAPFAEFVKSVTQVEQSEESLQASCEHKPDLKKYLELYLLRDFLVDESGDIDFEAPYHFAKQVSLKNLVYKINDPVPFKGDTNENYLCIEGEYDLVLEFVMDYDRDDKNIADMVKDRHISGSFELAVDSKANISIENMDIGWDAW